MKIKVYAFSEKYLGKSILLKIHQLKKCPDNLLVNILSKKK